MQILILEDLEDRKKAYREKFSKDNVFIVDNVKDTLDALTHRRFDLLILDHDLEGKAFVDVNYENCGSRVAEYLAKTDYQSRVIIGSLNPNGAQNMLRLFPKAEYKPGYWAQKEE